MKIYIYILFFLLILSASVKADNIYPWLYKAEEYSPAGRRILFSNSNEIRSYYLTYNLAESAQSIYSWKGLERKDAIGESLENVIILDLLPDNDGAFLCYDKNSIIYAAYIDKNLKIKDTLRLFDANMLPAVKAEWKGSLSSGGKLLLANESLYLINADNQGKYQLKFISSNVSEAVPLFSGKDEFAFITDREGSAVLAIGYERAPFSPLMRIQYSEDARLKSAGKYIFALTGFQSQTLVQVYDKSSGESWTFWIDAKTNDIEVVNDFGVPHFIFTALSPSGYKYYVRDFNASSESVQTAEVSNEIIESIGMVKSAGSVFSLFRNGIAKLDFNGNLVALDFYQIGGKFETMPHIYEIKDYLILSSPSGSLVFKSKSNKFWQVNRAVKKAGNIILPFSLLIALLIAAHLYRRQKRILKSVFQLPQSGFIFVINKKGALIRANDSGKSLLRLPPSAPLGKRFTHYCNFEEAVLLKNLFERAYINKETFTEKLELPFENTVKEAFFTAAPITSLTGGFKEITISGVDITAELEKKRLVNWAQLAHDMQTNLSAIRLNAQSFDLNNTDENEDRRKRILQQSNILTQRVRDILAVGRDDKPDFNPAFSEDICLSALEEFDPNMFPNIELKKDLKNFQIVCDKSKIIRAIRNAVENSLKAIKDKKGVIIVKCYKEKNIAYFHIIDDGPGMTQEVKNGMFTPYFTTRKSSGGTGIGAVIMQKAIEIHKGRITINSEPGKGSELIFSIPIKQ